MVIKSDNKMLLVQMLDREFHSYKGNDLGSVLKRKQVIDLEKELGLIDLAQEHELFNQ